MIPQENRVARLSQHQQQHLGRDSRQLTSPYKPKSMMILLATTILVPQRAEQPAQQCQQQW
jgi:hypothetical protein